MAIQEKLGISITQKYEGVTETFVANGIRYLEFRAVKGNDPDLISHYVDLTLAEKEKSGILTPTVHLPHLSNFDLSALDETERKAAIENQKNILKLLLPLKPSVAVVHASAGVVPEADYDRRKDALIRSLQTFAPYCRELGVRVAVENLTQVSMVQTGADMMEVLEGAADDNVGVCFDVNHVLKEPPTKFIQTVGKHIITMHVSDNDGKEEKHFLPGDGVIDWKAVFSALQAIDYQSTMIVECGWVLSNFPESVPILCEKWQRLHA